MGYPSTLQQGNLIEIKPKKISKFRAAKEAQPFFVCVSAFPGRKKKNFCTGPQRERGGGGRRERQREEMNLRVCLKRKYSRTPSHSHERERENKLPKLKFATPEMIVENNNFVQQIQVKSCQKVKVKKTSP